MSANAAAAASEIADVGNKSTDKQIQSPVSCWRVCTPGSKQPARREAPGSVCVCVLVFAVHSVLKYSFC